jgi:tetratricopeptide (TPR) repeat protein
MLDPEYTADERFGFLPTYLSGDWLLDSAMRANPRAIEYFDMQKAYYEATLSLVGKMAERGVKFLAGSDYPNPWCYPGFSLHDEMALMVEGGMNNLEALQTATLNPAIFLNKEDSYGKLAKGKKASMILLDKNPLEDISNTKSISAVFVRGKAFMREELDKSLEDIKYNLQNQFELGTWLKASAQASGLDAALDSLDFMMANENCNPRLVEKEINGMGYEMMFKGDMESAEKLLKKNVELFPESYNVYDSYAEVQMKLGNYDEAKKNFQKTLELNPWSDYSKAMLDSLNSGGSPAPSGGSLKYFMPHSTAHFLHEHNHDHK